MADPHSTNYMKRYYCIILLKHTHIHGCLPAVEFHGVQFKNWGLVKIFVTWVVVV